MSAMVTIMSEPKGGNPGGLCLVESGPVRLNGYFKYCHTSKIYGCSSFRVGHQPLYEALTFQLVREMDLQTTNFYVLMNGDRSTEFRNWRKHQAHDPNGRDYYFISQVYPPQEECSEFRANELIRRDKVYLDSLMVGDVIGRRQNYRCYPSARHPRGEIVYLDLGCSFVYARFGELSLPHKSPPYEAKTFKTNVRRLSHISILSPKERVINLGEFIESIPTLQLPILNPNSFVCADSLLSEGELKEIQNYLSHRLLHSVASYRARNLVHQELFTQ